MNMSIEIANKLESRLTAIRFHLFTAVFLFCCCGLLNADDRDDDNKNTPNLLVQAIVVEAYIDMRLGPGIGYATFYVAERGEMVTIEKSRNDWYKVVNKNGVSGWVHAREMRLTTDINGDPLAIETSNLSSYNRRKWEFGMSAGDFGGNDLIAAYSSYHFNKNLSSEFSYIETFGNAVDGRGIFVKLVHQPFPHWKISPFVAVGGGIYESNPRSNIATTESRSDNVSLVAAGIQMYLAQRLFLRLQYNNYLVITDRDNDEEIESWSIGISAYF